jgi:hypothetical protein
MCGEHIEVWVLHKLTTSTPYGGICWYAQDLAAALSQKYMHCILLAHECVALAHVNIADL